MDKIFIDDQKFEDVDFSTNGLTKGDYENCEFVNCILSGTNLSDINFVESTFVNCDMTMSKLANTAFMDVSFKACKLIGLQFDLCNKFLFQVHFDSCQLNLSSFYKVNLTKILFNKCQLQEVDFVEANLGKAHFKDCDLQGAIFENTILENADFRSSYNFSIDPEKNRVKKAKFCLQGLAGLLDKYDIEIE